MGVGEGDLLLALGVVGGRAAFEIDGAVGHQRNAGRRRHRIELDLELVELELLLHGIDDLAADVHGVADRLLVVIEIGEGDRRIAEAERDGAGILDVLQRSGEFLRHRRRSAQRAGQQTADNMTVFHVTSPFIGLKFIIHSISTTWKVIWPTISRRSFPDCPHHVRHYTCITRTKTDLATAGYSSYL